MKKLKLKSILEEIDIFSQDDNEKKKISEEQRNQVMEFIKNFHANNEAVYRKADLKQLSKRLEVVGKISEQILVSESEDWFDTVSLKRDVKSLNESIKVFTQTANEVNGLQQRLESAYEDCGTKLGKYFDIEGLAVPEPSAIDESKKSLNEELDDEFFNALHSSTDDFIKQFDRWGFDERDHSLNLRHFIEKRLKRKMSSKELKTKDFLKMKVDSNKILDAAENIGYENRKGDRQSQAKAKSDYENKLARF